MNSFFLRLIADCPLLREESPSEDPDMLVLVDAGLVEGTVGWLEGERTWTYRVTPLTRDVAAEATKMKRSSTYGK